MLMICPKVISNSPEGLQQSLDVIYKHAQEWKLKENIKKSNIIIFSSNGHLVVTPMQGKFLAKRSLKIIVSTIRRFRKKPDVAWKRGLRALRPGSKNKWVVEKVHGCH